MFHYDAAQADDLRTSWERVSGRAYDPWADVVSIIGILDSFRTRSRASTSLARIENALGDPSPASPAEVHDGTAGLATRSHTGQSGRVPLALSLTVDMVRWCHGGGLRPVPHAGALWLASPSRRCQVARRARS